MSSLHIIRKDRTDPSLISLTIYVAVKNHVYFSQKRRKKKQQTNQNNNKINYLNKEAEEDLLKKNQKNHTYIAFGLNVTAASTVKTEQQAKTSLYLYVGTALILQPHSPTVLYFGWRAKMINCIWVKIIIIIVDVRRPVILTEEDNCINIWSIFTLVFICKHIKGSKERCLLGQNTACKFSG